MVIAIIFLSIFLGFFIFLTFKLQTNKTKLESDIINERKTSEEKLALLQDSENRLKTEFENLANKIFEDKGKMISDENREKISGLLEPFRRQLDSFRQRIDTVHTEDTKQSTDLIAQVRQLQELSNKVSTEANNLATAIKGDTKKQGNWGEVIIERIFEVSGLERGREFNSQPTLRNEDGSLQKPDFCEKPRTLTH